MEHVRISWNVLRNHLECKQKTYLRRNGKKPTIQDHRNFFGGTVTDMVVREWLLRDPKDNLGVMPSMVEDVFEQELEKTKDQGYNVKWRDASDRERLMEECKLAVSKIEPALIEHVLPHSWTPDFAFKAPLEVKGTSGPIKVTLNGYMDILVRHEDGSVDIWDVKHTKDDYYWKKTVGQLAFYDLAMSINEDVHATKTGLLQPLCKQEVKTFDIDPDWQSKILVDVSRMADDIVEGVKTKTKDVSKCQWCEVKHACDRFATDGKRVKLF